MTPADPPAAHQASRWVASHLGSDAVIGGPLPGGITSDVRLITTASQPAVLKQVTNDAWLTDRPDVVAYEARVLGFLAASPIPVPRVVAVDAGGDEAGYPAMILSHIDAGPAGVVAKPSQYMDAMLDMTASVTALDPPGWIRPFARYVSPTTATVPPWSKTPIAWQRAIEIVAGEPPTAPTGLIHRDYHPWNVLWDDAIVGVVDWSQTSNGPVAMDVAHCRQNLAISAGHQVADDYRTRFETATGIDHHPYWDLITCVDLIDDWVPRARENRLLDDYVGRLVAEF